MTLLTIFAVLYFLPSLVALLRGHCNTLAIVMLNLLLGWTAIGWIASLVWAFTSAPRSASPLFATRQIGSPVTVDRDPEESEQEYRDRRRRVARLRG